MSSQEIVIEFFNYGWCIRAKDPEALDHLVTTFGVDDQGCLDSMVRELIVINGIANAVGRPQRWSADRMVCRI
jgi:hypothetical protein